MQGFDEFNRVLYEFNREFEEFKPLENTAFDKSASCDQLNSQVSTNSHG